MRRTPVENSSESREKVSEGAGWLPGVWKLKWGRVRVPCGVQFDANVGRGRNGVDIVDVDVMIFSF